MKILPIFLPIFGNLTHFRTQRAMLSISILPIFQSACSRIRDSRQGGKGMKMGKMGKKMGNFSSVAYTIKYLILCDLFMLTWPILPILPIFKQERLSTGEKYIKKEVERKNSFLSPIETVLPPKMGKMGKKIPRCGASRQEINNPPCQAKED